MRTCPRAASFLGGGGVEPVSVLLLERVAPPQLFLDSRVQPGCEGLLLLLDQCCPLISSALCSRARAHSLTSDRVTGRLSRR